MYLREPGKIYDRKVRFFLAFWNIDMVKTVEAGDFALWVAPDSQSGEEVFFKVVD